MFLVNKILALFFELSSRKNIRKLIAFFTIIHFVSAFLCKMGGKAEF